MPRVTVSFEGVVPTYRDPNRKSWSIPWPPVPADVRLEGTTRRPHQQPGQCMSGGADRLTRRYHWLRRRPVPHPRPVRQAPAPDLNRSGPEGGVLSVRRLARSLWRMSTPLCLPLYGRVPGAAGARDEFVCPPFHFGTDRRWLVLVKNNHRIRARESQRTSTALPGDARRSGRPIDTQAAARTVIATSLRQRTARPFRPSCLLT